MTRYAEAFTPTCSRCGRPYSEGPCAPTTTAAPVAPAAPARAFAVVVPTVARTPKVVRVLAPLSRPRPNRAQRRATRKDRS